MTAVEITAEKAHRIAERLAIMCGASPPTPEQRAQANIEANRWEREFRKQHPALTVVDSSAFAEFRALGESL